MTISYSDDAEAAWLRKGNRGYYGYKTHAATDSRDGFVLGSHATPANRSDTEEFAAVLSEVDVKAGESIFVDKGYSSSSTATCFRFAALLTESCTRPLAAGN